MSRIVILGICHLLGLLSSSQLLNFSTIFALLPVAEGTAFQHTTQARPKVQKTNPK